MRTRATFRSAVSRPWGVFLAWIFLAPVLAAHAGPAGFRPADPAPGWGAAAPPPAAVRSRADTAVRVRAWGNNDLGQTTIPASVTRVAAVAAGGSHNLALRANGTVAAWGDNSSGQATIPTGLSSVRAVAAGGFHSLALRANGTVIAWGGNASGQATVPGGLSGIRAVAAGFAHSLALRIDGTVVAWGRNAQGQATVPAGLTRATAIAAGVTHSLALRADGTVIAWGSSLFGQATVPVGLSGVTAIAAGERHSLALRTNGTVAAWGDNSSGQAAVPAGLTGVIAIAAGAFHSLALRVDGTVVAWGEGFDGQTTVPAGLGGVTAISGGAFHSLVLQALGSVGAWGENQSEQASVPPGLAGARAIAGGGSHSLAVRADGTVAAWGLNDDGQGAVPPGVTFARAIAAGGFHNLVVRANGTVTGWGVNDQGQVTVPAGLGAVRGISAGGLHSLALRADGTVAGWGEDSSGQVSGATGLTGLTAVAAGGSHSLGLRANGTVAAWGENGFGQTSVPSGVTGVTAIAAGPLHSLALRVDGTVAAWGDNSFGQTSVPPGLTDVTAIAAGASHSVALRVNGTVVVWGSQDSQAVNVPAGFADATAIAAGNQHNLALKADLPPGLQGPTSVTTREDAPVTVRLTVFDSNPDRVALTVSSTGTSLQLLRLGGSGSQRTLSITPAPNANGAAVITVSAHDNQFRTTRVALALTILPVNDPPAFTKGPSLSAREDAGPQSVAGWATNLSRGPADEAGQTLSFETFANSNSTLFAAGPAVASNGTLTYTPAANRNGLATLSLRLRDSGGTANGGQNLSAVQTFTIQVRPVNDAPSFTPGPNQTVAEDSGPRSVTGWARNLSPGPADEAGQRLTFVVTTGNTALFAALPAVAANGTLTFTPSPNAFGSATVTVRLRDDGGQADGGADTSGARQFSITVMPANDPPRISNLGDVTTHEGTPTAALPFTVANVETPAGSLTVRTLSGNPTLVPQAGLVFGGSGASRMLTVRPAPNQSGTAVITVTVSDGTASTSDTFVLTVTPVAPLAPTGPRVQALSGTQVEVGWTGSGPEVMDCEIERKPGTAGVWPRRATVTDSGLTVNTTHSFRVRAVDAAAVSHYATSVAVTTLQ